jgi:hypothetical protein
MNILLPTSQVFRHAWRNLWVHIKWTVTLFDCVASSAGRNAIASSGSSSTRQGNEMLNISVSVFSAISTRPIEIIQSSQPFLQSKRGNVSAFSSRVKFLNQYFVYPFVFTMIALWAYLSGGVQTRQDVFAIADNTYLLIFILCYLSASVVIVTDGRGWDVVFSKPSHIHPKINAVTAWTHIRLFTSFLNFPLPITYVFHDRSLKHIPVSLWRYCLGSIRKTNGNIGNYKRKSAERTILPKHSYFTTKLEQVCL